MAYKSDETNLLVVVLDTNPVWWGKQLAKSTRDISLINCVEELLVFCNFHLMMNQKNKLCVIAAHSSRNKFLYPKPDLADETASDDSEHSRRVKGDGQYELFSDVSETIRDEVKDLIYNDTSAELHADCMLSGAMSMGLCYINRIEKEQLNKESFSSRILVIKGSEDHQAQYLNFMMAIFTAQKQNTVIDACVLDNESSLLQQACDITNGIYLKIPQLSGLLQYLLWIFLPDTKIRAKMTLPTNVKVDYRAACFCHRNLVDIGYVCSVCLSIYCSFTPICSTCHSTFKILGPRPQLKKKGKK